VQFFLSENHEVFQNHQGLKQFILIQPLRELEIKKYLLFSEQEFTGLRILQDFFLPVNPFIL